MNSLYLAKSLRNRYTTWVIIPSYTLTTTVAPKEVAKAGVKFSDTVTNLTALSLVPLPSVSPFSS